MEIRNSRGETVTSIPSGEPVVVRVRLRFHEAATDPMVGILIRTRIGMDVYGTNTHIEQMDLGRFQAGDELEVDFHIECWLTPQEYTLTVASQNAGRVFATTGWTMRWRSTWWTRG